MLRTKIVVALYPFRAIEGGDLSLEKVNKAFRKIAIVCAIDTVWSPER